MISGSNLQNWTKHCMGVYFKKLSNLGEGFLTVPVGYYKILWKNIIICFRTKEDAGELSVSWELVTWATFLPSSNLQSEFAWNLVLCPRLFMPLVLCSLLESLLSTTWCAGQYHTVKMLYHWIWPNHLCSKLSPIWTWYHLSRVVCRVMTMGQAEFWLWLCDLCHKLVLECSKICIFC